MKRRIFLGSALLCAGTGYAVVLGECDAGAAEESGVRVSTFGADGAALQRAIDTGLAEIVVDTTIVVFQDIRLRSRQTVRFDGGRIVVARDASIRQAVLDARGTNGVTLLNPVIEASQRSDGVVAIQLFDSASARISGGRLTRSRLTIESHDARIDRDIEISNLQLDMQGYRSTAVYLSGVRGVILRDVVCSGAQEGVGVYNNARAIRLLGVVSRGHLQDGFVVIAGQDIQYKNCRAYGNGQSGFTTQRQRSGEDVRFISWTDCRSSNNGYDGFDIRGATDAPWNVDTGFVLHNCRAWENKATGFYVVQAEGTMIHECMAVRNRRQNLFIDHSDRVVVDRFTAVSGAVDVASGPNKAGILVYSSRDVHISSAVSGNGEGRTQEFGLSFTGSSTGGHVVGSDFSDNVRSPVVPVGNELLAR